MDMPVKDDCMELIKYLHDTNVITYPVIENRVNRAINTGDCAPLYKFLDAHPFFLALADRNRRAAEHRKLNYPFDFPDGDDIREYLSGPLKLGYVNQFDDLFGIDWDILSMPTINAGRVKSGKSILVKYLLCQILRKPRNFNVLIPDLKKEYRNLLPHCRYLRVLKKERININPFEVPPWRHPLEHIFAVSRVFVSENYLIGTSMNELIGVLEWLYKERGVFEGSKNYPNVLDVYNAISARLRNSKWGRYIDVLRWLQNRLLPYTKSETFACQYGIPFDVFRTENLVLEMDKGFTDLMYNFSTAYIAELLYSYNKEMNLIGSKLRHLFNVDEARILFNANRDASQFGESIINEIVSKSREFGIGFFLSSQESASFNQLIRSLSYLKIAFPLNDAKDIDFIQESFGLEDDQAAYLFRLPPYGRALVRYGGYEKPFILQVPYFNPKKILSDNEIEDKMADFYFVLNQESKKTKRLEPVQSIELIPPNAAALLYFLGKKPFTKVSAMTNAAGFNSPAEVYNAIKWLEKNGFIEKEPHRVSRRGRKSIFYVLTRQAHNYLGIKGLPGKGNFEHKLYQHLICEKLKNDGLHPKIEGTIRRTKKSIDVLVQAKDGHFKAYEVTLQFANVLLNVHQDFSSGVSKVIIVTRDKSGMEKAVRLVDGDSSLNQFRDRIIFSDISEFFD
jgi:DNA-binding PadR family transcriptional regulator